MQRRERRSRVSIFLLAVGACLMLTASINIYSAPDLVQYMAAAPAAQAVQAQQNSGGQDAPPPNESLGQIIEKVDDYAEELSAVVSNLDVSGEATGVTVATYEQASQVADLTATGMNYFKLYFHQLEAGRFFYDDELKYGDPVAIIDDQLAFKLFGSAKPLDGEIKLGEKKYRIVGIVKSAKSVAYPADYRVFVPIQSLISENLSLTCLTISGRALPGKGAGVAFPDIIKNWGAGDFHDIYREQIYSTLLIRILLAFVLITAIFTIVRRLNSKVRDIYSNFRQDLASDYAKRLAPPFALKLLLALIGYAALIGGLVAAASFALEPAKIMTDWVPSNLVDWREITKVFWTLRQAEAGSISLSSPQIIHIRFFESVATVGVVVSLMGLVLFMRKLPARVRAEGQ